MHVKLFESVFRRMEDLYQISFQIYIFRYVTHDAHFIHVNITPHLA